MKKVVYLMQLRVRRPENMPIPHAIIHGKMMAKEPEGFIEEGNTGMGFGTYSGPISPDEALRLFAEADWLSQATLHKDSPWVAKFAALPGVVELVPEPYHQGRARKFQIGALPPKPSWA